MELRIANAFLHQLDGQRGRTYGATCSDIYIGQRDRKMSIPDLLVQDFVAARGKQMDEVILPSRTLNLMNVGHCRGDFRSFTELRDEILAAKKAGGWLVYHLHGVGAETKELYIERDVHEELLNFLERDQEVWTQPFITVANLIRQWKVSLPDQLPSA